MKKIPYTILVCLFTAASTIAFTRYEKYAKKSKKKSPVSEQVNMRTPTDLPFHMIHGQNRDEIIHSIRSFPKDSYQLFSIPKNGYFYLDPIDDFIKSQLKNGHPWEEHIQKLIREHARPGSIALDIGAHIGTHTLVMAQSVEEKGQVFAFEPQPKIFRELFLNMTINALRNISFYWAGVGDHEGQIGLSPLNPTNEGGTGLSSASSDQHVQLLTIDSLHLSNVSLMKIDVEGMENQVLDGARETILANHPVIIIEIMGGNDFGKASREVREQILRTINILEDLGYQVTQLWNHDWIAIPSKRLLTNSVSVDFLDFLGQFSTFFMGVISTIRILPP